MDDEANISPVVVGARQERVLRDLQTSREAMQAYCRRMGMYSTAAVPAEKPVKEKKPKSIKKPTLPPDHVGQ